MDPDQQGERREYRQDIGAELGVRRGKEREDDHAPQKQETPRLETGFRNARPCARQGGEEAREPGEDSGEQHGDEIPHGLIASVLPCGKALEVLVDEEETREFRVGERNRDEPRRDNRQEQQPALDEVQPAQQPPVAMNEDVGRDCARGKHDPDEPLGHDGERRGRPGDEHPAASLVLSGVLLRDGKGEHRHRYEKSQSHVQRQDVADSDVHGATRGHSRSAQCGRRAEQAPSRPEDHEHAQKPGHARREARRPLIVAERGERGRGDPILQGRLLEVLVAVQARREPVAACDHLARNLRVAALVGLDQVPIAEIAEPAGRKDGKQDPRPAPGNRRIHPISRAAATLRSSARRML